MENSTFNLKVNLIFSSFITIVSILILIYLILAIAINPNSLNGTTGSMISLLLLSFLPLFLGIHESIETIKELREKKNKFYQNKNHQSD